MAGMSWFIMSITILKFMSRLVVLLIGRLRLSLSQAIEAYTKLMLVIPTEPAKNDKEREENSNAFKAAFLEVLEEAGVDPNAPILDESAPKM
jgi:hypothetical protein